MLIHTHKTCVTLARKQGAYIETVSKRGKSHEMNDSACRLVINDQAAVVISVLIRTPPLREKVRISSSTEDGERENKNHNLGSAVQSSTKDIVVLHEPLRVTGTEVPLREPCDSEVGQDRRVDANAEPANKIADNRSVDVVKSETRIFLVDEPEGYGDEQSN